MFTGMFRDDRSTRTNLAVHPSPSDKGIENQAPASLPAAGHWQSHSAQDLESSVPGSTPPGRVSANTSAAVAASSRRSTSAGSVASNPRVHQASPRMRTSVSSTSHRGSLPSPRSEEHTSELQSENRLIRRLLLTGLQPAWLPLSWLRG